MFDGSLVDKKLVVVSSLVDVTIEEKLEFVVEAIEFAELVEMDGSVVSLVEVLDRVDKIDE